MEEHTDEFAANWGWQTSSNEWRRLVNSYKIDLVDVATPNFMHAPVAMAAIHAGKHVACEKPIAGTLKEAKAINLLSSATIPGATAKGQRLCGAL